MKLGGWVSELHGEGAVSPSPYLALSPAPILLQLIHADEEAGRKAETLEPIGDTAGSALTVAPLPSSRLQAWARVLHQTPPDSSVTRKPALPLPLS